MSETSTKELDNMEKVTEGSKPVTKNAKPGDPIATSGSQISNVIDVNTTLVKMLTLLSLVRISQKNSE